MSVSMKSKRKQCNKSRSVLRREAIQRGKPMPSFEPCWCLKTKYKCQECLAKEPKPK